MTNTTHEKIIRQITRENLAQISKEGDEITILFKDFNFCIPEGCKASTFYIVDPEGSYVCRWRVQ